MFTRNFNSVLKLNFRFTFNSLKSHIKLIHSEFSLRVESELYETVIMSLNNDLKAKY